MKVNLSIKSDQLNKDELRSLLQAIRDCEMATFPDKEIYVSAEVPELNTDEMTKILTSIKPPYDYGPVIFKYTEEEPEMELKKAFSSWKCHICGDERPDEKISVLSKPRIINGQDCGTQNIRYCNDRPTCIEGAKEFSFFKEESSGRQNSTGKS